MPAFEINRNRTALAAVVAITVAWGIGCTRSSDAQQGDQGLRSAEYDSDESMPSLYVDRIIQHGYVDGVNRQREGYLQRVKQCQEANLPTVPLTTQQTELLGTTRVQIWRGQHSSALREETWDSAHGEISRKEHCEFRLVVSGEHIYYDTDRTIWRDLATGETGTEPPDPTALDTSAVPAPDEAGPAGGQWQEVTGPTTRSVTGQPCKEWKSSEGSTTCIWSGGTNWGFDDGYDGQFSDSDPISLHRLVLGAEPGPGQESAKLTTQAFVIGGALDAAAMMPEQSSGAIQTKE